MRAPVPRSSGFFGELGELLGLVLARERVDQLVELAVHDAVDLVKGEVDAVVGDAALRKVVGADARGAVARADERFARRGGLRLLLRELLVADARGEHRERFLAVLVLRARVLAFDDDPGRQVRYADGGFGLVDVLAAGARGAEGVDAQLRRVEDYVVQHVGLRQDGDGASRSVDAALCFGLRDALHAVATRFKLELRIDALPDDARDALLVAADLGGALRDDLDLPAVALGIA